MQEAFPQIKFFWMGLADVSNTFLSSALAQRTGLLVRAQGVAGLLMLFGGVHTSGSTQALLNNAVIPMTMLLATLMMGVSLCGCCNLSVCCLWRTHWIRSRSVHGAAPVPAQSVPGRRHHHCRRAGGPAEQQSGPIVSSDCHPAAHSSAMCASICAAIRATSRCSISCTCPARSRKPSP